MSTYSTVIASPQAPDQCKGLSVTAFQQLTEGTGATFALTLL